MKGALLSCVLAVSAIFSVQAFTVTNKTDKYAYLYGFSDDPIVVAPDSQYECDLKNLSKELKVWVDGACVFEKKYDDLGVDENFDTTRFFGITKNILGKIEAKFWVISHEQ